MMNPVYGPPPWRLAGRAFSVLCRLQDAAEARRHVPEVLEMGHDPIIRIRFWDLIHDAGLGDRHPVDDPARATVREAVVAFPARFGDIDGDHPAYMYADDPTYREFGRETMGWPLRDGQVHLSQAWPDCGLASGVALTAVLERNGRLLLRVTLELTGASHDEDDAARLPRWFALRAVPRIDGPGDAIRELVLTGPSRFRRGRVYTASAEVEVGQDVPNELGWLRPREIVAAELWSGVDLTIGYGRQLADLRPLS